MASAVRHAGRFGMVVNLEVIGMNKAQEQQRAALGRARDGTSGGNYGAIYSGFIEKGLSESDIQPRVNIFTYAAWQALGRQVRKGERGVHIVTYIPVTRKERNKKTGEIERKRGTKMKAATVFHLSQTDAKGAS